MISCNELNKILRSIDNETLIKKTNKQVIAISNKKYQKIDFNYESFILSEIFYKSFLKYNTLNYKIIKYYYLVKEDIYKRVLQEDLDKYLELGFSIYHCLYRGTLSSLKEASSYDLFYSKLKEIAILKKNKDYVLPKLLIHSCCGPCSSYVIDYLHQYFDITIIYYNPNIYPSEEYYKRVETQKQIISCLNYYVKLIICDYHHQEFQEAVKGYQELGEGSRRCYQCYAERLEYIVSHFAKEYDYFTTTLSISPYKNSKWINEIGLDLEKKYHYKFLYSDFKLNDGYKKSIELSKKFNLYRQDYCGCEYSLNDYHIKLNSKK